MNFKKNMSIIWFMPGWSCLTRHALARVCADRANFTLNLDIAKPPSLNEAVPEIKIGKGTRCSTIELHRPRPVIGFEPIPAAYQAKYPPPAHQARPRAVTPSRDQGSGWKRDLNPHGQFLRLIAKYQPDSHREGIFSCAINVNTTVGPARLERVLTV